MCQYYTILGLTFVISIDWRWTYRFSRSVQVVLTKHNVKFLMKRKHKPEKRPSVMISYHWKNYTVTLTHFPSKNMREKIDVIPRSCFVRILMILSRIQPLGKSWWQVVKLAINPQRRKYDWMIMLITEA